MNSAPVSRPRIVELERRWTFTALGIRFRDPATEGQVRDGLRVVAHPGEAASPAAVAFQTASGLYAFQGLPGLREAEFSGDRRPSGGSPPAAKRYVVEVADRFGRFLPLAFAVDLPLPFRGPFAGGSSAAGSPPDAAQAAFYLFSAPTRRTAPGLSAVRADLMERSSLREAAYAALEIEVAGAVWLGLADERGRAAVLFPTPRFERRLPASPPISVEEPEPAQDQSWDLTVRVRYSRSAQRSFAGTATPDIRSLVAQPPALIFPDESAAPMAEWGQRLSYGQELCLRTANRSELLVEALGSPP